MDAEHWLECDMWVMAPHVQRNASDRKRRLLAVAFCRHVEHLISEARCRQLLKWAKNLCAFGDEPVPKSPRCLLRAVDAAEQFADGLIGAEELAVLSRIALLISFVEEYHYACYDESWGPRDFKLFGSSVAADAIHYTTAPRVDVEAVHKRCARAVLRAAGGEENKTDPEEEQAQRALVHDLFPDPSCSYEWQPEWSSPRVAELAKDIYQRKVFEDLPALGKVLRRAGCKDERVLAHCKGPGPHVRGCWVVDAALGKS